MNSDHIQCHRPHRRLALALGLLAIILSSACARDEGSTTVNPYEQFGITANNAFFYYDDLEAATRFYTETLGIKLAADYGFAKILQIAPTSYLVLVDGTKGMHTTDEPKSVALALITDQLDEWWDYLETQDIEVKHGYNPVEGRPHHGFVILDPEGYYLEFERFNEHPENELLIPILEQAETITVEPSIEDAPGGLGFKATVLWLYYRDMDAIQRFYEDKFGLTLTVDQGWTKIYQTSPTGLIGLVDETRGMHNYSEEKAVTVSFFTDSLESWFEHVRDEAVFELRSDEISEDEAGRFRAFVGYDPEGYYLEFDTFLPHELNESLMQSLRR